MKIEDFTNKIIQGDVLETLKKLPSDSIDCVITSPPYYALRRYLDDNNPNKKYEIGLEPVFDCKSNCGRCFMCHMMAVMKEIKRVLKPTGTCWINFGDSYGGQPGGNKEITEANIGTDGVFVRKMKQNQGAKSFVPNFGGNIETSTLTNPEYNLNRGRAGADKCLLMQPERFAIRCVDDLGFILRNKNVWAKQILKFNKDGTKYTIGSVMPTSVKTRFNESWEYLFFFVKNNKTILWRNKKTKEWANKKPPGINGIEGKDWEFQECFNKKPDCKRCGGTGFKKVSLWQGYSYWCDLDAVRLPYCEATWQRIQYQFNPTKNDIQGAVKYTGLRSFQKRLLKYKFNYGVRDAVRKAGQPQLGASPEEEELCPICGRSWKRHASPNASDRKAGIRREFIPCVKNDPHRAVLRGGLKSLEERMKDTKNKDTKSSRTYNIKKLLSEIRLGIKPNIGMIPTLGKNLPTCWQINLQSHTFSKEFGLEGVEHFAYFPENLCTIPILFGSPPNGIVLDPFAGSFTTCLVAEKLGRKWIGIELSENYCKLGQARIGKWRKENNGELFDDPEGVNPPEIIKLD